VNRDFDPHPRLSTPAGNDRVEESDCGAKTGVLKTPQIPMTQQSLDCTVA
jgi:hypothetical protein